MKFFRWLQNLRRRQAVTRADSMRCSCCRQNIHKGERFIIEAARHRDCSDPKQTGQGRLFEPVPHMINGEQVNIAPMASMGTELLGTPGPAHWPHLPPEEARNG